jgi:hypothetical protein
MRVARTALSSPARPNAHVPHARAHTRSHAIPVTRRLERPTGGAREHAFGVGGSARARRRAVAQDDEAAAAASPSALLLDLLGSTASPSTTTTAALQSLWHQELLPEFERHDAALRERCAAVLSSSSSSSSSPPPAARACAVALVAAAERAFLALRRATALASHLSGPASTANEQQQQQQQQRAAAAVLAEARARLEELLARDVLLAAAEAALRALPPPAAATSTSEPLHNHHRASQLVRRLRRDGWQPRRAAEAAPALPAEAQRRMQDGLAASARASCAAAALELTSDALAPRVEADAEGAAELLGPLGLWSSSSSSLLSSSGVAAEGDGDRNDNDNDGAAHPLPLCWSPDRPELVLALPLVEAVLARHPRDDVREAVGDAAMAPRTDALLRAWLAAGGARRRLARARGEPSHAAALASGVDGMLFLGPTLDSPPPWGFEVEGKADERAPPSLAAALLCALERRLQEAEHGAAGGAGARAPVPEPPPPLDALFPCADSASTATPLLDRALRGVGEVAEAAFGLRLVVGGGGGGGPAGDGADPAAAHRRTVTLFVEDDERQQQRVAGVVIVDPTGGYGTRQLLFGSWSPGGGDDAASAEASSSPPPTASVGLQAGALLLSSSPAQLLASLPTGADPWQAAADALAELAHELGHALHFLLSTTSLAAEATAARSPVHGAPPPPSWPVAAAAMEQPLWLLELPSTLLELLCADERALARMVLGAGDGGLTGAEALAAAGAAAGALAARQARRRDPRALRGLAALMRADEAVSRWSGPRAPSAADAARAWREAAASDDAPALLSPDQARAAPRVLSAQGQAYGYLVAWCLASAIAAEMVVVVAGGGGDGNGAAAAAAAAPAAAWIRAGPGRAVRSHLLEAGSGLPAAVTARQLIAAVLRDARGDGGAAARLPGRVAVVGLSAGGGGGDAAAACAVRAAFV